jgi:hypothetical protein
VTEEPIYIGTTHRVDLDAVKLKAVAGTSSYVNDADSCTYSLQTLDDSVVSSGDMDYVSASNGRYTALVPYTATELLEEDVRYDLVAVLTVNGLRLTKVIRVYGAYYR